MRRRGPSRAACLTLTVTRVLVLASWPLQAIPAGDERFPKRSATAGRTSRSRKQAQNPVAHPGRTVLPCSMGRGMPRQGRASSCRRFGLHWPSRQHTRAGSRGGKKKKKENSRFPDARPMTGLSPPVGGQRVPTASTAAFHGGCDGALRLGVRGSRRWFHVSASGRSSESASCFHGGRWVVHNEFARPMGSLPSRTDDGAGCMKLQEATTWCDGITAREPDGLRLGGSESHRQSVQFHGGTRGLHRSVKR